MITVVGLISGNDETTYREEVKHLVGWCMDNNLVLMSTSRLQKVTVWAHTPQHQWLHSGESGEHHAPWSADLGQTSPGRWTPPWLSYGPMQRLHFLRKLKQATLPPNNNILQRHSWECAECITTPAAINSDTKEGRGAEIIGVSLPSIQDLYQSRCLRKATLRDPSHPLHELFKPQPSGVSVFLYSVIIYLFILHLDPRETRFHSALHRAVW